MAQTWHAVDHDDAGFGRAVERLDRLHDRRLRQSPREDRADEIEPRHRCHHVDGHNAVFDCPLAGCIVHDLSTHHVSCPDLIRASIILQQDGLAGQAQQLMGPH